MTLIASLRGLIPHFSANAPESASRSCPVGECSGNREPADLNAIIRPDLNIFPKSKEGRVAVLGSDVVDVVVLGTAVL